MAENNSS